MAKKNNKNRHRSQSKSSNNHLKKQNQQQNNNNNNNNSVPSSKRNSVDNNNDDDDVVVDLLGENFENSLSLTNGRIFNMMNDVRLNEQPSGLPNLGNTCYFNSVMQIMGQTYILYHILKERCQNNFIWKAKRFFWDEKFQSFSNESLNLKLPSPCSLTIDFLELQQQIFQRKSTNPRALLRDVQREKHQFEGYAQQDAQELLITLLDALKKAEISRQQRSLIEALKIGNAKNPSDEDKKKAQQYKITVKHTVIDAIFGGQLLSIVHCTVCDYRSFTFEPFIDLSLSLQDNCSSGDDEATTIESTGSNKKVNNKKNNKKIKNNKKLKSNQNNTNNDDDDDDDSESLPLIEIPTNNDDDDDDFKTKDKRTRRQEKKAARRAERKRLKMEKEKSNAKSLKKENQLSSDDDATNDDNNNNNNNNENSVLTNGKLIDSIPTNKVEEEKGKQSNNLVLNSIENIEMVEKNQPIPLDNEQSSSSSSSSTSSSSSSPSPSPVPSPSPTSITSSTSSSSTTSTTTSKNQIEDNFRYKFFIFAHQRMCRNDDDYENLDLGKLLRNFIKEETLDGSNKYLCENCSKKNNGKKTYSRAIKCQLIALPPPVLILQLKRFEASSGFGFNKRLTVTSMHKLNTKISFPEKLYLSPYTSRIYEHFSRFYEQPEPYGGGGADPDLIINNRNDFNDENCLEYTLYGVVIHSGSLRFGHYMAYVCVRLDSFDCNILKKFLHLKPFISDIEHILHVVYDDFKQKQQHQQNGTCDDKENHHHQHHQGQQYEKYDNDDSNDSNDGGGKNSNKKRKWYVISDSSVSPITLDAVLRDATSPYLLFYERTN